MYVRITSIFSAFLVYLLFSQLCAQTGELNYKQIAADLPTCFIQDTFGFVWIGTQRGLLKYDGYKFKHYTHNPSDSTSLSSNWITAIEEDSKGNLFIGTKGSGLNYFNQKTERIIRYSIISNDMKFNFINCLEMDKDILCIGTESKLITMNINGLPTPEFNAVTFSDKLNQRENDSEYYITTLLKDKKGNLWIGTRSNGLIKHNRGTGQSKIFKNEISYITNIGIYGITSLCEDRFGNIWFGTGTLNSNDGAGLCMFNQVSEEFLSFKRDEKDPNSICSNRISTILIDKQNEMVIGSFDKGVFYVQLDELYNKLKPKFKRKPGYPYIENVKAIYQDNQNNIWIAPWDYSIVKYNMNNNFGVFSNYRTYFLNNGNFSLFFDSAGKLWFGTAKLGLVCYDTQTSVAAHYPYYPDKKNQVILSNIYGIDEDAHGNLWLAAQENGLYKFNKDKIKYENILPELKLFVNHVLVFDDSHIYIVVEGSLYLYKPDSDQLVAINLDSTTTEERWITGLHKDKDNILWVASFNGIYRIEFEEDKVKRIGHYSHKSKKSNSLSINQVTDILHPSVVDSNAIWIATSVGLNRLDLKTNTFSHYFTEDGLNDNFVCNLLEDNEGNIWFTTAHSVGKYNIHTKRITSFVEEDGLVFNNFEVYLSTKAKGPDGKLYFTAFEGTNCIDPVVVKENNLIPDLYFTDFKIFNKKVKLDTSIQFKKNIILNYYENSFSFDFTGLNFINADKNQFAYRMEGFNNNWINIGTKRSVSFTNFDPGEYVLWIKGSNNHGIWNEKGISLNVFILPPWWRTTAAYFSYIVLFLAVIYGLWQAQLKRLRTKHQLDKEHFEAEKLREMDTMKSHFFANISHEFRTPLTLILGPVRQMLSGDFKGNLKEQYQIIIRNGERLLRLINQLMDLAKFESGKLQLRAEPVELIELLRGLVQAFESLARIKDIKLKFHSPIDKQEIYLDTDKFEKIINNLLSNAFKFTPEGGKVKVDVVITSPIPPLVRGGIEEIVSIFISNSGPGIATEHLNNIFNRFYQVKEQNYQDHTGSGIGLFLVKEFVELHHGTITVDSTLGQGITFTINLPLGKVHLKKDDIIKVIKTDDEEKAGSIISASETDNVEDIKKVQIPIMVKDLPSVLIVEDNTDMRCYIINRLKEYYKIFEAEDGSEGLAIALKHMPDLIISDIMMPQMDGMELCEKLKTDERTSHIPLIMLTARAESKDKIEGLHYGADDFIAKPFDADELSARADNLIKQRKLLREKYSKNFFNYTEHDELTDADQKFVQNAFNIINKHLPDPDFSVEGFSREIAFSRYQLHRKIKALTNLSISAFIRSIRLKHAEQMLSAHTGNVSEIAYECGFNNLSYFSRCFKEMYGVSPAEYMQQVNKGK